MSDVINRLRTIRESMGQGNTTIDFVSARVAVEDAIEDLEELNTLRAEIAGQAKQYEYKLSECAKEKDELIAALEQAWLDRDAALKRYDAIQAQVAEFDANV